MTTFCALSAALIAAAALATPAMARESHVTSSWHFVDDTYASASATALHPIAIADGVPKFEIARECQGEGGTEEVEQRCVADEVQARKQLQTEWIQFSPGAKLQCNEETGIDGTPSYVELLTCLEMERDVRIEREASTSK
jgi:hypothetical protein